VRRPGTETHIDREILEGIDEMGFRQGKKSHGYEEGSETEIGIFMEETQAVSEPRGEIPVGWVVRGAGDG
jgi:hypothetical protein